MTPNATNTALTVPVSIANAFVRKINTAMYAPFKLWMGCIHSSVKYKYVDCLG